jgi:hypothetical protein
MSRAHERAYRLLAERVQLRAPARYALYAMLTALIASGAWWLIVHYGAGVFPALSDDLVRAGQEGVALKVHGAAAMLALIALGAMLFQHAPRGWVLARNRGSGALVVASLALLALTGYALYYLVTDAVHSAMSVAHWLTGLLLAPLVVVHIVRGRRSRGRHFR